jgi:predicted acetyltransferase
MKGGGTLGLDEVGKDHADVLDRLLQLYLYDFSEIEGLPVGEDGRYQNLTPMADWLTPGRHAFLVRVDGELAGCVLVKPAADDWSDAPSRVLEEFFVMRKFRRRGVGREVTRRLFDRLPGRWSLNQTQHNYTAQAFWRTVLAEYTGGRVDEVVIDGRPTQTFDTTR